MRPVIIVGGGVFGCVAARLLAEQGAEVTLITDDRPMSGSVPAAGLIKPSWLTGFGEAGKVGLEILGSLFLMRSEKFVMRGTKSTIVDCHMIDVKDILKLDIPGVKTIPGRVLSVTNGRVHWVDIHGNQLGIDGEVLVTAGVWSSELVKMPPIQRLRGSAFLWKGTVPQPTLELWAPFKQTKVFNIRWGVIWSGDSTGLKPESYTKEREQQSRSRCAKLVAQVVGPDTQPIGTLTGDRPVVAGHKAGYFAQVYPHTWVATGGGKMGISLAGYYAQKFLQEITN